eukprot:TRINITY_DN7402_c1_g1_i1.p1 TRINITY_DN7402_c1_g1~~TRINITY_DN7402_c1_g1_i1.p1  ORF type:complete len:911 (-),score=72.47 TRINITY_DN7402_c1_g1_i1:80-2641(-)
MWKIVRGSIVEHGRTCPVIEIDIHTQYMRYNLIHLLSSKYIGCFMQSGYYNLIELTNNQVMEERMQFEIGPEGLHILTQLQGQHFVMYLSQDEKQLQMVRVHDQLVSISMLSPSHDCRNIGHLLNYLEKPYKEQSFSSANTNNDLEKALKWLQIKKISCVQGICLESLHNQNLLLEILRQTNAKALHQVVHSLQWMGWLALVPLFQYEDGSALKYSYRLSSASNEMFHGETFKQLLAWFFHRSDEQQTIVQWRVTPKSIAKILPMIWSKLVASYPVIAFQMLQQPLFMPSSSQLNPYSFHRLVVKKGSSRTSVSNCMSPLPESLWEEIPVDAVEVQTATSKVVLFRGAHQNDHRGLVQPLLNSTVGYEHAYNLPSVRNVIKYQSATYGHYLLLPEVLLFLALVLSFNFFALGTTYDRNSNISWRNAFANFDSFILTIFYGIGNFILIASSIIVRFRLTLAGNLYDRTNRWVFLKTLPVRGASYIVLGLQILYLRILEPWVLLVQCLVLMVRYGIMEATQMDKKGLRDYFNSAWNYLDVIILVLFGFVFALYLAGWEDLCWGKQRAITSLIVLHQLALSFKLLGYLRGFKTLGPTVQMIFEVFRDAKYFLLLLGIIITSFAIMFVVIFGREIQYNRLINPDDEINGNQVFSVAYENMFHSLLGSLSMATANIELSEIVKSEFIFIAGPLFGIFILLVHIVLLNLLVAILSNAYEKIRADEQARFLGGQAAIIDDLLTQTSLVVQDNVNQYLHILESTTYDKQHLVDEEWNGVATWVTRQLEQAREEFKENQLQSTDRQHTLITQQQANLESTLIHALQQFKREVQLQQNLSEQRSSQALQHLLNEIKTIDQKNY